VSRKGSWTWSSGLGVVPAGIDHQFITW
jgi:hypothetical protein